MEDPRAERKVLAWEGDEYIGAKNSYTTNHGYHFGRALPQPTTTTTIEITKSLLRGRDGTAKRTLPPSGGKVEHQSVFHNLILADSGEPSQAAKSSGRDVGETLTGHASIMKLRSPQSCASFGAPRPGSAP
ncbi:hypothetical protein AbraIFM66951_001053 [Aspergillus brasiliensis]|uniref:Uncharacterized protein n=1 Tax=Aspergillus brasiliensis TaxID=319629 RepID=A0A9W5Z0S6_9EURO|nr:hypothetical protein AbraCBS73388_001150 [Aspergillus brasiliensis]GKZ48812.1 hypothetical protein AbraIFM66951_001053 [Aspergillus brasiliensis]